MIHLERFLGLLSGVERRGGGWCALCPVHPDHDKSLMVGLGEGNRILFHCHSCGRAAKERILSALGLTWKDLFAIGRDRLAKPPAGVGSGVRPVVPLEIRHRAYTLLSEQTDLADHHREALLARGLTAAALNQAGYFSLEKVSQEALEGLYEIPGFVSVPGVIRSRAGQLALAPSHGIGIPVRNWEGQIAALLVRTGYPRKYALPRGTPCWPHIPLWCRPAGRIWITEGPLKADVAGRLGGLSMMGLNGVTTWPAALQALTTWAPRHVSLREIVIAFDSDWSEKPEVASQREQAANQLMRAGYRVLLAGWDRKYKGLDDLLLAGGEPVLTEAECVTS